MDGLRWLLLLFGLLLIGGVYLYSQREKREPKEPVDKRPRVAPTLDDGSDDSSGHEEGLVGTPISAIEPGDDISEAPASTDLTDAPQKIVTLRIVGRDKNNFAGDELVLSMRGIGLRHGKFGIFHRYDGNDESRTVFSAASLVEPGSFDLQNIKDQEIPGISLFLVLPGPVESVEGFDLMMSAARALTQSLNGELLDESGSTLSIQRERYMREEIIQFQHSSQIV